MYYSLRDLAMTRFTRKILKQGNSLCNILWFKTAVYIFGSIVQIKHSLNDAKYILNNRNEHRESSWKEI